MRRLSLCVVVAVGAVGCRQGAATGTHDAGPVPGATPSSSSDIRAVAGGGAGPSCADNPICGMDNAKVVSCCDRKAVAGGKFLMGRDSEDCGPIGCDADAGISGKGCPRGMVCDPDEQPEHTVTVSSFYLDTFQVTVSRFRKFVDAFETDAGVWRPQTGIGVNPHLPGSGWQAEWNTKLAHSRAELIRRVQCDSDRETFTDTPGAHDRFPINCVDWYTAFAFCLWDGARMPTEAEWEYASVGGDENRVYPWGTDNPEEHRGRANFSGSDHSPLIPVGSHPSGAGRWGQQDLWQLVGVGAG